MLFFVSLDFTQLQQTSRKTIKDLVWSLIGLQTFWRHWWHMTENTSQRYWSSFSRSPMFSRFSISFLMPLIQDCASSADSATRSRLPLRPRKTSVKHRSAGNSSAMLSSTSDWWPSRIASTSLTETGHKGDTGWKTDQNATFLSYTGKRDYLWLIKKLSELSNLLG